MSCKGKCAKILCREFWPIHGTEQMNLRCVSSPLRYWERDVEFFMVERWRPHIPTGEAITYTRGIVLLWETHVDEHDVVSQEPQQPRQAHNIAME